LNELERLTTQISLNTQKLEFGLEKGNPLHLSLLKSKKSYKLTKFQFLLVKKFLQEEKGCQRSCLNAP